ncbi:energy-coupling factor transporter ATPase [Alkalibacillus silvisoli]|uniref:Energy-coupling factor transporter ATP-binding protein EcfA2 n=1 Tax=Alkalibacillus silvisoli TaxID=392823 RepID=A0ABP3K470_9BACI
MDIIFKDVNYTYQPNTPFSHHALKTINLEIQSGSFIAIVGHTGSGKSTLLQHLNGLLKPTSGQISLGNTELPGATSKQLKDLRQQVGLVFQNPEHQLFEETVKKDLLFGPKNFGFNVKDVEKELNDVMEQVGLDHTVLERSPFELSGGQMRRVAIAGMLLVKPQVLVLDEPTAGLDPSGQKEMLQMFKALHEMKQHTIILVTHSMEDALNYAEQVVVMNQGQIECVNKPEDLMHNQERLRRIGLDIPEPIESIRYMKERLGLEWQEKEYTEEAISRTLIEYIKAGATS